MKNENNEMADAIEAARQARTDEGKQVDFVEISGEPLSHLIRILRSSMPAKALEATQVMTLRPGDVLVFRSPLKISSKAEADIKAHIEGLTGHGSILVLDAGAEVQVLRPEKEPAEVRPWWKFWSS